MSFNEAELQGTLPSTPELSPDGFYPLDPRVAVMQSDAPESEKQVAIRELMIEAYPIMRWRAAKLIDRESVDDVVQKAAFDVWGDIDKYKPIAPLWAWVKTIVRNEVIDQRRREVRRPSLAYDIDLEELDESAIHEDESERRAQKAKLYAAIDQLKPQFQLPIRLLLQDLPYEEIARRLEIPLGTVQSRIHRAKKALALLIEKEEASV